MDLKDIAYYKPSEVIGIFDSSIAQEEINRNVIFLRGIYKRKGANANWVYRYDSLRDEGGIKEITLKIAPELCNNLKDGNLITVGGILCHQIQNNGNIQLLLEVSRVDVIQQQVVDETEQKLIELRKRKYISEFKNVNLLLESKLYKNETPRIALLFAENTETKGDFWDGIRAAQTALQIEVSRVAFTRTAALCAKLKELDTMGYDVVCMVRGGGIDPKTDVDKPEVIETVINLKTAFVSGVGHKEEDIFLRQVADFWTPTPQGLGQFFSDLVESVAQRKSGSQAATYEKLVKQHKDEINTIKQQKDAELKLKDERLKFEINKKETLENENKRIAGERDLYLLQKQKLKTTNRVLLIALALIILAIILTLYFWVK